MAAPDDGHCFSYISLGVAAAGGPQAVMQTKCEWKEVVDALNKFDEADVAVRAAEHLHRAAMPEDDQAAADRRAAFTDFSIWRR